jgi:hypothetical protein
MVRLELAPGPTISMLELNSKQIVDLGEFAVFDAGLAAVICKLERNNRIGWNRILDFKTGARWGNVFQHSPLTPGGAGFRIPLNLDQVGAKLSLFVFSPLGSHRYSIGSLKQWFRRISESTLR